MDRSEWRSFYGFIESANADELKEKQQALTALLEQLTDPNVISDARKMVCEIEREMVARQLD